MERHPLEGLRRELIGRGEGILNGVDYLTYVGPTQELARLHSNVFGEIRMHGNDVRLCICGCVRVNERVGE